MIKFSTKEYLLYKNITTIQLNKKPIKLFKRSSL